MVGHPKVLICEDEELAALALETLLVEEGFVVVVTHDGCTAVRAVESDGFDLVLTDLQVPGLEGRDLVHGLRRRLPEVPIIVMTGRPPEEGEAALDGAEGTLLLFKKPLDFDRLLAEAHRLTAGSAPA